MGASRFSRRRFTWLIEDQIIAMSRPYGGDLPALQTSGVDHIVSLTISALPQDLLAEYGITGIHLPLADMAAPTLAEVERFVKTMTSVLAAGGKVAVHCGAGLGRTGTMLACYLVSQGRTADEAIDAVRRCRPGSVESFGQEQAIHNYEHHLRAV
jgi:atypical dual specificity phosphatase